jgi:hypothetical protein
MLIKTGSVLASIALLSLGCGAFSTKKKGQKQAQNDIHLAGTWKSECAKADWLGLTSEKQILVFSALGDFERTSKIYADAGCMSEAAEFKTTGTFDTLGASSIIPSGDNINYTVTSASALTRNETGSNALNLVNYCGTSTWSVNQTVDIIDKECAGGWRKGSVVFDVYRLDTDQKRVVFGRQSFFQDKRDAASRPGSLDETHALILE